MANCEDLDKRTKAYKDCIKNQKEGLGDVIESIAEKTGIKKLVDFVAGEDCGCNERKQKLNDLFPRRRKPVRCLTEQQHADYSEFVNRRTLNRWEYEDIKLVINLYAHIFAVQYNIKDFCIGCQGSAKKLFVMTEELDKVYESYYTNLYEFTQTDTLNHGNKN